MLTLILIVLGLAALYCGGTWAFMAAQNLLGRFDEMQQDYRDRVELYTFHLGLCCILASGFIGLIIVVRGG